MIFCTRFQLPAQNGANRTSDFTMLTFHFDFLCQIRKIRIRKKNFSVVALFHRISSIVANFRILLQINLLAIFFSTHSNVISVVIHYVRRIFRIYLLIYSVTSLFHGVPPQFEERNRLLRSLRSPTLRPDKNVSLKNFCNIKWCVPSKNKIRFFSIRRIVLLTSSV